MPVDVLRMEWVAVSGRFMRICILHIHRLVVDREKYIAVVIQFQFRNDGQAGTVLLSRDRYACTGWVCEFEFLSFDHHTEHNAQRIAFAFADQLLIG